MQPRTIYQVLEESAAQYGDALALRQPVTGKTGQREYLTYTWNEYKTAAQEIAAGLRSIGIRKGDVVALDAETRLEFYLADLGILTAGGIAAALYPSYPPKDLTRTIRNCGAKALFVEDPKTFEALRGAPDMPRILLTGEAEGALTLAQLRERGRLALAEDPGYMARLKAEVTPSDYAILYLTSGATGEPKMALVTHSAVVANLDMGPTALPIGPHDTTVAFLPSAHIAQRVVVELLPMRLGTPVNFAESLLQLPQDIRAVRPTMLLAPPRMWERIYSTICTELRKRPAVARKAFYGALGLALAAASYKHQGKPVPVRIRAPLKIADKLFFAKVRERFGGRLAIAASGAAPLSKDLAEFYEAIGMPLVEGYGLTEGGVVA
ncbi:MAG TPA: AMP-binding protein, partial [Bryobacteraceae bacterium]|nr:AMP-binding protein [Bryobacteraceae bacterium]